MEKPIYWLLLNVVVYLLKTGSSVRRIYRVAFGLPSDEDGVGFWCDPEDGCIVIPETRQKCRSECTHTEYRFPRYSEPADHKV